LILDEPIFFLKTLFSSIVNKTLLSAIPKAKTTFPFEILSNSMKFAEYESVFFEKVRVIFAAIQDKKTCKTWRRFIPEFQRRPIHKVEQKQKKAKKYQNFMRIRLFIKKKK